ncbi:MAG: Rrf2 family transcriptional regulator [Actinobacteria bacterium]|jgi:Rrf2 family protein|nr:Rrf2 family transcriptional regulator [Actinomycetota bacterium]
MKMSMGKRGDYAVRAVLMLARNHGDGRRKSREIAAEMAIPERFLPQILADLIRGGVVISVAGPDGGYELARPPEELTLLEVMETAEGPIRNEKCVLRGGPCHWEVACAVHPAWSAAQDAFIESLAGSNFSDLAATDRILEAGGPLPTPESSKKP